MGCKGFLECLLKLLNFLLTLVGLAMVGYGVYMFVIYTNASKDDSVPTNGESVMLGRPMLMAVSLSSSSIFDNLPTAWFIYLFVGIGAAIFIISVFGCIGAATRSGCCLTCVIKKLIKSKSVSGSGYVSKRLNNILTGQIVLVVGLTRRYFLNIYYVNTQEAYYGYFKPFDMLPCYLLNATLSDVHVYCRVGFLNSMQYSVLVILLILVELGCAAFIFFDKSWKSEIPLDKTANFDRIYGFLEKNWEICRWVALGAVVLEALVFLLALMVRAANSPAEYDSDDEYIAGPRQQRQPLISRQPVPATPPPVTGTLDSRPSRNDAWSTRMREKYGLDTTEFTYNPNEPNRMQASAQPTEEKSRCSIM